MVNIDKSQLNVNDRESVPYSENLLDFAYQVVLAKPLCNLVIDNECLQTHWKSGEAAKIINTIKVFQEGEELGYITTGTRYLAGNKEQVYGVGSFRIRKERGGSATTTKDIKVALRTIKRNFVSRADDELIELIANKVHTHLSSIVHNSKSSLRWDVDPDEEILFYSMQAYHARKRGEDKITLPSRLISVKDEKKHELKCEYYEASSDLELAHHANTGYGVMVKADEGYVVYDYALGALKSIRRFMICLFTYNRN